MPEDHRRTEKKFLIGIQKVINIFVEHGHWTAADAKMTSFIAQLRFYTPPQLYFDILDSIGFDWCPQRTRFFENIEDLKDFEDQ